jgi:hypothetical protein
VGTTSPTPSGSLAKTAARGAEAAGISAGTGIATGIGSGTTTAADAGAASDTVVAGNAAFRTIAFVATAWPATAGRPPASNTAGETGGVTERAARVATPTAGATTVARSPVERAIAATNER